MTDDFTPIERQYFGTLWQLVAGRRGSEVRGQAVNNRTGVIHEFRFGKRVPETFQIGPHICNRPGSETVMIRGTATPKRGRPGRAPRWHLKKMMMSLLDQEVRP